MLRSVGWSHERTVYDPLQTSRDQRYSVQEAIRKMTVGASLYEPINVFKPMGPDIGIVDGPFEYLTVGGVTLPLPFTIRARKVLVAIVDRFEFAAVNRHTRQSLGRQACKAERAAQSQGRRCSEAGRHSAPDVDRRHRIQLVIKGGHQSTCIAEQSPR